MSGQNGVAQTIAPSGSGAFQKAASCSLAHWQLVLQCDAAFEWKPPWPSQKLAIFVIVDLYAEP